MSPFCRGSQPSISSSRCARGLSNAPLMSMPGLIRTATRKLTASGRGFDHHVGVLSRELYAMIDEVSWWSIFAAVLELGLMSACTGLWNERRVFAPERNTFVATQIDALRISIRTHVNAILRHSSTSHPALLAPRTPRPRTPHSSHLAPGTPRTSHSSTSHSALLDLAPDTPRPHT